MAKILKRLLALGAAAALLLACAACGEKPPVTTEPASTEGDTTEPKTIDAMAELTTEEPTTEETTTAETTTGVPQSKAEIIAYVNEVMKRVREEKPGYTFTERTVIDDQRISSSKGFINSVAPPLVRMAKGIWSKWTDPDVKAKGADHGGVHPKVDLTDSMVKSATCTESGGTYSIRINFVNENVPELPVNESSTMHGRVMSAMEKGGIEDGAGQVGVTMSKFGILYSGSYILMTVNKATGLPTKINSYVAENVDMIAKVPLFGEVDAKLPIAGDRMFTF
ncbi:MAG: hypothetical protein FWF60_08145 [Oscillospiraceae bacterium]|nr:hypothetical protein [Oscillospiraceae bacterium]